MNFFLQLSLEGSSINGATSSGASNDSFDDITQVPRLSDELRYFRPKKFTLKGFKRMHFVLKELNLAGYKSARYRVTYLVWNVCGALRGNNKNKTRDQPENVNLQFFSLSLGTLTEGTIRQSA